MLHPPGVRTERQEYRRVGHVLLITRHRRQLGQRILIAHNDDAIGLDVRGRRRTEGGAQDRFDLLVRDRLIGVFAHAHAVLQGADSFRRRQAEFIEIRHGMPLFWLNGE